MKMQLTARVEEINVANDLSTKIRVANLVAMLPLSEEDAPRVDVGDVITVEVNLSGPVIDPDTVCLDGIVRVIRVSEQGNAAFQK